MPHAGAHAPVCKHCSGPYPEPKYAAGHVVRSCTSTLTTMTVVQAVLPVLPVHAVGEHLPAGILRAPGRHARQDHVPALRGV